MADDPSSCEHFIVDVLLQGVDEEDKSVLENLLQLYRYDPSVVRGYELSEHGTFVYRFLDGEFKWPSLHLEAWRCRWESGHSSGQFAYIAGRSRLRSGQLSHGVRIASASGRPSLGG
jgi:hypothetical protein